MNIIIANQKGGAGKTTHCVILANYLVLEKKQEVAILDMDFQASIKNLWDSDRETYSNEPLYEVIDIELDQAGNVIEQIKNIDGHVIIDLPGRMDDNNLVPVFQKADLILCPFSYDKVTFESTYTFAQVVRQLNKSVPLIFVPNRLKAGVKYSTKDQVNKVLKEFGVISPEISDKVAFQRIDTLTISDEIKEQVMTTYDWIYNNYINKTKK